ncbi:caspase family protein [Abyssibius alkaniclasticus]|uniref:caspase family protein n=1 Tax=Abyssibius alkaniclasticus TaxID=2881234 RepID=UPI0023643B12|nr:caspase family protein [Abyssibius alkaniclasticus]UPH71578.1 caspase family protein [Abyssibius alkaniclasticus]
MMLRHLLSAWLLCLAGLASAQPRNLALIVGIDSYDSLPSLARAVEDASGYVTLFDEMGYEVTALTDPGSTEFRLELARFYDSITEGDSVAFVYSGHGWSDGSQNYLVPADTPASLSAAEAAVLSLPLRNGQNGIMDEIAKRGAGLSLAIIDACRNNPFDTGETRALGLVSGLAPVEPPAGSFIVYSAGANQTALDRLGPADDFQYSVFTRFFLPNLREFGDLRRAIVVTRSQVQEAASIINHNQRPAYYDELSGSACLIGTCDALAVPATISAAEIAASQFAESEWGLIQNSTDTALLGAYMDRYRDTVPEMAERARARIAALQPETASPPGAGSAESSIENTPAEAAPRQDTTAEVLALNSPSAFIAPAPGKPPLPGMTRSNVAPPAAVSPVAPDTATTVAMPANTRSIIDECDAIAAMWGNPDNPPGLQGRLSLVNIAAEAVATCDVAVRNHPDIPRMRFNLAAALYDRGERGDFAQVHDISMQLMREGYAPAGILLGNLYFLGDGVEQDWPLAADYLRRAEAGGFKAATAILAYRDLIDESRVRARGQAFLRLNQLVAENDVTAQYLLGAAMLFGEGVRQNVERGLELSELAGQQGHAYAYESIAEYYEGRNNYNPDDIALALQYYARARAAGSATADFYVGNIYSYGTGVPVDHEQAFNYYQAAARLNHAGAYNNLAFMYENGQYVEVDLSEAVGFYEISSELGSEVASYNLALAYLEGKGVPVNYAKAADLFMLALERGNRTVIEDAGLDLGTVYFAAFQRLLQARGYRSGPVDGFLSRADISAMEQICNCAG